LRVPVLNLPHLIPNTRMLNPLNTQGQRKTSRFRILWIKIPDSLNQGMTLN
jgi:hypothetical protein